MASLYPKFRARSGSVENIYLNGDPDLQSALDKVTDAGGQIIMPKTDIGQGFGFMAFFIDTEGNVIGLHSNG